MNQSRWDFLRRLLGNVMAATVAAGTAGIMTAMIVTGTIEGIGLGLFVLLYVIPSIVAYAVLDCWKPTRLLRHVTFWLPILAFGSCLFWLSTTPHPDGGDFWAWYMGITILFSALGGYIVSLLLSGTANFGSPDRRT